MELALKFWRHISVNIFRLMFLFDAIKPNDEKKIET